MLSSMFLDMFFIVPPLIDKEKKKANKKRLALLYKCLSANFSMNSRLNNKRGSNNTIGMASVRFVKY